MPTTSQLTVHFWILCGLFVGFGGALLLRFKMRDQIALGELDERSANRFVRGWCLAILLPCLLLWLIGLSNPSGSSADYLTWSAPQKWVAIGLNVACWLAILAWVFLGSGATILSRHLAPTLSFGLSPSPLVVRVLSVILVASGAVTLIAHLASQQS